MTHMCARTKAHIPRDHALQQEKSLQWESHTPQLESRPCSPELEKSPCSIKDPVQPKTPTYIHKVFLKTILTVNYRAVCQYRCSSFSSDHSWLSPGVQSPCRLRSHKNYKTTVIDYLSLEFWVLLLVVLWSWEIYLTSPVPPFPHL